MLFQIITFESIVNALLPTVLDKTLSQCLSQIVKYLSTVAVYCSRPICCAVACRSLATIFNKMEEGKLRKTVWCNPRDSNVRFFFSGPCLEEQIEYLFEYTSTIIESRVEALRLNSLKLMLFVTKSLLFRGYSDMNNWLDKVSIDDQILFIIERVTSREALTSDESFKND